MNDEMTAFICNIALQPQDFREKTGSTALLEKYNETWDGLNWKHKPEKIPCLDPSVLACSEYWSTSLAIWTEKNWLF